MSATLRRAVMSLPTKPVAILGAGTQGQRLAYMWSSRGGTVNIIDSNPAQLKKAVDEIKKFRSTVGVKTGDEGGEIVTFLADDRAKALKDAWLAVECVPESLKLKRSVIADLDAHAPEDTIISSNSSSYTIKEILEGLDLKEGGRFLSLHSYWPPETAAIEVMASPKTRPDIVRTLMEQCRAHGFSPFEVRKNSNGYIYNRIWAAIKREALLVAATGVATPSEIDAIYKNVLKTPVGPFEQMDVVGLDVVLDIENHYAEQRTGLPDEPRKLLEKMKEEGKLGVKTGEGFYKY